MGALTGGDLSPARARLLRPLAYRVGTFALNPPFCRSRVERVGGCGLGSLVRVQHPEPIHKGPFVERAFVNVQPCAA